MIIAILGYSGSGKTVLTNFLIESGFGVCPMHTTSRTSRYDDNGFYKYVGIDEFKTMMCDNKFIVASGDGKRYYGIERKEFAKVNNEGKNIILNISIKDIKEISKFDNVILIMTKYKILNYYTIKKVGFSEAIKRLYIYLHDRFIFRKLIKKNVNYIISLNSIKNLLPKEKDYTDGKNTRFF